MAQKSAVPRNMYVSSRDEFECSYLGSDPAGKLQLEAHRYVIEVTVVADPAYPCVSVQTALWDATRQVISFDTLKTIIQTCVPDKSFILGDEFLPSREGEHELAIALAKLNVPLVHLGVESISAEILASYIGNQLTKELIRWKYPFLVVSELRLRENSRNYVTWKPSITFPVR